MLISVKGRRHFFPFTEINIRLSEFDEYVNLSVTRLIASWATVSNVAVARLCPEPVVTIICLDIYNGWCSLVFTTMATERQIEKHAQQMTYLFKHSSFVHVRLIYDSTLAVYLNVSGSVIQNGSQNLLG